MDDREKLDRLAQALERIEARLGELERRLGVQEAPGTGTGTAAEQVHEAREPSTSPSTGMETGPEPGPQPEAVTATEPAFAAPGLATSTSTSTGAEAAPAVDRAVQATAAEAHEPPKPKKKSLEVEAGLTWLNRIGAVTLVLGLAFFLKYAIDNEWIGPAGRVLIGVLTGVVLVGLGERSQRRKEPILAQGLSGAGVAALYLSFYASFGFYKLVPQFAAFGLMILVTALAGALAVRYRSLAIAIIGLAGGYATPILLSTGVDRPVAFFAYVALLNAGALFTGHKRKWHTLDWLAILSTGLLFILWAAEHSSDEKRWIAVGALTVFLAQVVLLLGWLRPRRWPDRRHIDARILLPLSCLYVAIAVAALLERHAFETLAYTAVFVVGLLAFADLRRLRELPIALWLPALVPFAVAAASHDWVPVVGGEGHLVAGYEAWMLAVCLGVAVLGWIAVAVRRRWPEGVGVALLVTAMVLVSAAGPLDHGTHLALMTGFFVVFLAWCSYDTAMTGGSIAGLAVVVANAGAYYAGAYFHVDELRPDLLGGFTVLVALPHLALGAWAMRTADRRRSALLALGVALTLLVLAVPVQLAGFRITIAWAFQALALLWLGRRIDSVGLRIAGIVVFAMTILRAFAWDLPATELPTGGNLFVELANGPALALLACVVALGVGARVARPAGEAGGGRASSWPRLDAVTALGAFVGACLLAVTLLALESYVASGVIRPEFGLSFDDATRESLSATLTSVSWGVLAVTLVAFGMLRASRALRLAGLSLVALTVGKVYVFDVWMLGKTERIVAFVVLGGLLLGASWAYARYRHRLAAFLGADEETGEGEAGDEREGKGDGEGEGQQAS